MSQPHIIPPIQCSTCGRDVPYTQVKGNTNRNQGRWLARCIDRNPETGESCHFFRWLAGSRTPSLSPRLGSTNILPALPQPNVPASGPFLISGASNVQAFPPAAPQKPSCNTMGCNSKRIRKGCSRRMCKAHCLEAGPGGCADPAHKGSNASVMSYMVSAPHATTPRPLLAEPTHPREVFEPSTSSLDPRLRQDEVQTALPPLASTSAVPMRTLIEPAFTSHMTDIYTTQRALEESMRETGRQMEATRLESKRKVQQTVFVYAWLEDGVNPALFEVQEGFVWPNFILNEAVLRLAGFENVSVDTRVNIFRFNLGHWTTVKTNHVVEVKDSACVFVKATQVQRCKDFEKFLSTTSSAIAPNIRTNLAGERAYVKKKMMEYEIHQASKASAGKKKRRLSTESPPSTPKRPHFISDEAPTPTLMTYRAPVPPPRFTGKRTAGATQVVKRKFSAARRERELMECYESDSGLEFSDPFPFSNPSPVPSTSRSASAASTATPNSLYTEVTVKQENVEVTVACNPFLIPQTPGSISRKPRWPADFYAVDIANCFNEIEDNAGDARVRSVFDRYFGKWASFKNSTFYDHRGRWRKASLEAKHTVLSAGRTKAGCWFNFMSTTPAPRALLKAVRKRNPKQVIDVVSPEVIEISSDDGGEA